MAKKKEITIPKVEVVSAMGRPTLYEPRFCEMLIKHRAEGYSFESFGAVVKAHRDTLYEWAKVHQDFSDAKKRGLEECSKFYEQMGQAIAMGQMRRLKSRTPVYTPEGKVVTDERGDAVYKEEYEPATTNSTAWIFLTKNLLGWRDRKDIEMTGKNGTPIPIQRVPDKELLSRFAELMEKATEE